MTTCLAWPVPAAVAAEETIRLRVSWGGGAERVWRGSLSLSEGKILEATPLGIEADEPGSMWLDEGRLVVRQRSARSYDGVDLLAAAPAEAKLLVRLSTSDDGQEGGPIEVPLAGRFREFFTAGLDEQGNRLVVSRSPGDMLRVKLDHACLVFSPGQALRFALEPHLLPVQSGTRLRFRIELCPARTSGVLWSTEHTAVAGEPSPIRVEVGMPRAEGVYDVVITAMDEPRWRLAAIRRRPLAWKDTLAVRKIQVVVLDSGRPVPASSSTALSVVEEIDPANQRWWERFSAVQQLPHLKRFWRGPLGSGNLVTGQHVLGQVAELAPRSAASDVSWEAYTLPIRRPGSPHVLEIEYPSDVPQTLGISIIEPNPAGAVFPLGVDSGLELSDEVTGPTAEAKWLRHRVLFWPRTKAPLVLVTNRRDRSRAVFGKIRVLAGWDSLPRAFPVSGGRPERLLAAYLDKPLFPENFSASESVGSLSELGVDDWVTFYQGGTRLVEYLNYVGSSGLMMSVLAQGSTIYPSRLVSPTPRYDTGVFLEAGQDPLRKDVLEMLFRLFDREGLQLIPALDFATPLPELEEVLRRGGPKAEGIAWVGAQGATWEQVHGTERGQAAYYNVLDPRVQEAMLSVIREVAAGYGRHASFAGIGLQLASYGYAQLPDPSWGMDDATIARFEQATGMRLAADGPGRFDDRARLLNGEHQRQWLAWRADQLHQFHRRVESELTAIRPDARLYLAGANMLAGSEMEDLLKPSLPRRLTLGEAMLRVGVDVRRYGQGTSTVLLRPERIAPRWSLADQAVNLEIERMPDFDRAFQGFTTPASLFFHQPQEARVASFDAKSPYQPCYAWLATEAVPSAAQNRRRFVHSLAAIDPRAMFDGSWQLPLGQEESLRPLVAAYRQLPAARFERITDQPGPAASQPVAFRWATRGDGTYVYVVNDAPFPVSARVRVSAPPGCRLDELTGLRQIPPMAADSEGAYWPVELEAYDLVAIRFSEPGVKLSRPQASFPAEVREALEARVADLGNRAAALRNPPVLQVLDNPGFEQPKAADGRIPGWTATTAADISIDLDGGEKHGGGQAVRMTSRGPACSLISQPFEVPHTGRLTMSVWLRIADAAQQPPLQLALQGKLLDRSFYRVAQVGRSLGGQTPVKPLAVSWMPVVVRVDDLPLDGLTELQLRFDLTGPGEVWIDDIQLCSLDFGDELVELMKLLWPAEGYLQNGQVSDCISLLEGYWPRFLATHVPPVINPVSQRSTPLAPAENSPAPENGESVGFLGRMNRLLPERLRF